MLKKIDEYCGTVVKIGNIIDLEGRDRIVHTTIFGKPIIVGKNTQIGDIGIYFPLETALSHIYASRNNLYSDPTQNKDQDVKGYFGKNRRVRARKMGGYESAGLFMPLDSILFITGEACGLAIGDEFNELRGQEICKKYVVPHKNPGQPNQGKPNQGKQKQGREKLFNISQGHFPLHYKSVHLGKSKDSIKPNSIVSITKKIHGTSGRLGLSLCNRKLSLVEKFLKFFGVKIVEKEYKNVFASRNVIKNEDMPSKFSNSQSHYYDENIWAVVNRKLDKFLTKGMMIYYEAAGYLSTGAMIQKGYDYGCEPKQHRVFIYRITQTSEDGAVYEFSAKQVQDWCKLNDLEAVPEVYYGRAKDVVGVVDENFADDFMKALSDRWLEVDCDICKNDVPAEGVVVRRDDFGAHALKHKSFKFLLRETKMNDKGETNIEDDQ